MIEILQYKTIDGKEFKNKEDALIHENQLLQKEIDNLKNTVVKEPIIITNNIPHTPGIYMLTNPEDEFKKYIGSTNNLNERYKYFLNEKQTYGGNKINEARKITHPSKWIYTILEFCNINDLYKKEYDYINFFNTVNNGYNSKLPSITTEKINILKNIKLNSTTTDYNNAKTSWESFLNNKQIKNNTIKVNFTKDEFIEKRIKYQKKYNVEKLVYNYTIKTIDKNLNNTPLIIDDIIFIPYNLYTLIKQRNKYQNNKLKCGVIYSNKRKQYKIKEINNNKWFNTENEAYDEFLKLKINLIKQNINTLQTLIDEDIYNILNNLTYKQMEKIIMI